MINGAVSFQFQDKYIAAAISMVWTGRLGKSSMMICIRMEYNKNYHGTALKTNVT